MNVSVKEKGEIMQVNSVYSYNNQASKNNSKIKNVEFKASLIKSPTKLSKTIEGENISITQKIFNAISKILNNLKHNKKNILADSYMPGFDDLKPKKEIIDECWTREPNSLERLRQRRTK